MHPRHLFVCTGPTCSQDGAEETLHRLQEATLACRARVRVTLCRCLGQCGQGPNMVVYPDGVWYARVGEKEVERIVSEHLLNDQPVVSLIHIPVD